MKKNALGLKCVIATLVDNLTVSYQVKHTLSIQPVILLLGTYPSELKTYVQTKTYIQYLQQLYS